MKDISFELSSSNNSSFNNQQRGDLSIQNDQKLNNTIIPKSNDYQEIITQNKDLREQQFQQQKSLESLKKDVNDLIQINQKYKDEINTLKFELQVQIDENIKYQQLQQQLIQQNQELKSENDQFRKNNQKLQQEQNELNNQLNTTKQQLFDSNKVDYKPNQDLVDQNIKLNQIQLNQKNQIQELNETVQELISANENLSHQLKNQLFTTDQKVKELDSLYSKKFVEIQENQANYWKTKMSEQNAHYQKVTALIQMIQQNEEKFQQKIDSDIKRKQELEKENEELKIDIEEYKQNFEQQSRQFQSLFNQSMIQNQDISLIQSNDIQELNQSILSRQKEYLL